MLKGDTQITVTNRDNGTVGYTIPDLNNLHRNYQAKEKKSITMEELRKLSYIPGGLYLLRNCLVLDNKEAIQELLGDVEPEYFYSEAEIKQLLKIGSLAQLEDCLDFAPAGVIELVKDLSIKVPLSDYQKRQALKDKIGFDVDAALRHIEEEKAEMKAASENDIEPATPKRRVTTEAAAPGRRTDGKYKIVSQDNK